jgi:hypothetical protein
MQLPPSDPDGFVDWVETEYADTRWSEIYRGSDDGVTVWSGLHPAFNRFLADLKPRLWEHGLVISDCRTDVPKTIDGEMAMVHWISTTPVERVVAHMEDMICSRRACTELIADAGADYCEEHELLLGDDGDATSSDAEPVGHC